MGMSVMELFCGCKLFLFLFLGCVIFGWDCWVVYTRRLLCLVGMGVSVSVSCALNFATTGRIGSPEIVRGEKDPLNGRDLRLR